MTARSRSLPLRTTFLPLVCILTAGCVTNSNPWTHVPGPTPDFPQETTAMSAPPAGQVVLARGQQIGWEIENAPLQRPGLVRSGRSVIGPDGTVEVGPYGCCPVVGLTEQQAATVLEKQLRPYVRFPRVRVRRFEPTEPVVAGGSVEASDAFVWRKAREETPPIRQVAGTPLPEATPLETSVPTASPPLTAPVAAGSMAGGQRHSIQVGDHRFFPLRGRMMRTSANLQPEEAPEPKTLAKGPVLHGGPVPPGPAPYGPGVPGELNRVLLPSYVIGPPDVLLIDSLKGLVNQPVRGPHLVRPDGTVGLGTYGSAMVAGLTLDQAREEVARVIHSRLNPEVVTLKEVVEALTVDVLAYNSKVFYVITDGGGYGEQVVRLPVTGNETVLDAIAQINGLSPVSSKHAIWIARRTPGMGGADNILKVDWVGITQRGSAATNYQVLPGDRIYIRADRWRTADAVLAKILSPFERILGITLLGGQTYNTITNRNNNINNR